MLDAAGTDSRKMFSVVNSLLGKDSASPILPELDDECTASTLYTLFEEKIQIIRTGLEAEENSREVHQPSYFVGETLPVFNRK